MDLILDRAIHGQRCALGELFLTEDEVQRINTIIAASGFRFIRQSTHHQATTAQQQHSKSAATHHDDPNTNAIGGAASPAAAAAAQQLKAAPTSRHTKRPTRPASLAVKDTPPRPSVKLVSPTTKRRANARRVPSAPPPVDDSSSEITGDLAHPKKRKKLASLPEQGKSSVVTSATSLAPAPPAPLPTLTTPIVIKETPKRPPIIDIKGDGGGAWEAACAAVCDIIENDAHAKYFLQPVNPEADGLPEYFKKVQNPMDLHTVRQKLEGKLYTHPFRWQHDIRSIFFNAFAYFEEGSPIWRSAAELAVTFENLCKENLGVNPYAIYRMEAPPLPPPPPAIPSPVMSPAVPPPPAMQPAIPITADGGALIPAGGGAVVASVTNSMPQLTSTESAGEAAAAAAVYSQVAPIAAAGVGGILLASSDTNCPHINAHVSLLNAASREISTGADVISHEDSHSATVAPAEERLVTDTSQPVSTAGASPSITQMVVPPAASQTAPMSHQSTASVHPSSSTAGGGKRGRPVPPKGVRFREGFGVVYTAECNGTPFEREMSRNPPVSALPPPCPVPAAQMTESKSPLIPTAAQKKSTLGRFKELDVTYRKAALDLVKNELGINSLLCALDSRYIPEVDVLPHLKQRQFLLFLKALVTQQKLAQDAHHLPATLPRILNWNTHGATDSAATSSSLLLQPQESLPSQRRKTLLDKIAGSSPVDSSPWVVSGAAVKTSKMKSSSSSSSSSEPDSSEGGSDSDSSSASSVYRSVPMAPTPPSISHHRPGVAGGASDKGKSTAVAPPSRMARGPAAPPQPSAFAPSYLQTMQPRPMPFGSGKVLPLAGMSGPYGPPRPFIPMQFAAFSGVMAPGGMSPGMPPGGGGIPPGGMGGMPPGMQRMTPSPMPVVPMGGPMMPRGMPPTPQQQHVPQDVYRQPSMTSQQRPRHQRLGLWRPGAATNTSMPPSAWSMPPQGPTAATIGAGGGTGPSQMNGSTCWGEWKTKVLQETFLSQTRNVGVASERESRAEKADAEI